MESKLRILISDDDKEFCSRCTAILRGCGFETTIAPRDGHLILEMIRDYQPDVVLMDIFMPYQDAIGVISQVRERGGNLPVFRWRDSGSRGAVPGIRDGKRSGWRNHCGC